MFALAAIAIWAAAQGLRSLTDVVPMALQLFMWEWSKAGASPTDFDSDVEHAWSPLVVHKTRRSLRAVHFHPHGAPLMLTAEVSAYRRNLMWQRRQTASSLGFGVITS